MINTIVEVLEASPKAVLEVRYSMPEDRFATLMFSLSSQLERELELQSIPASRIRYRRQSAPLRAPESLQDRLQLLFSVKI